MESQACLSIPQRPAARGSERVLAYGHTLLSSATAELSRDVRSYLKHPDKLFRRVRDERDNLTPAITGDATLAVVYEQDAPSEVASARAGQATVTVVDDGVVIAHAEPQSLLRGLLLASPRFRGFSAAPQGIFPPAAVRSDMGDMGEVFSG